MVEGEPLNFFNTALKSPKVQILFERAKCLFLVREFFKNRKVLEVDCPLLSASASVDAHIDLIQATCFTKEIRFLHSSPEYGMKRLLSEGLGDIYQLSHVFRDGEKSPKHNPEFMMIEWYRIGFSLDDLIQETIELIQLFLGPKKVTHLPYREAFKKYVGIDYVHATESELHSFLKSKGIATDETEKDPLLDIILTTFIEPHLGQGELTVLKNYPSTQAALAKTQILEDETYAMRFEIYCNSLELCNGYHELRDPDEQLFRLNEQNQKRKELGKPPLPIDENFLEALRLGLPDCSGVAVGFDRLMMLKLDKRDIGEVLPFSWSVA